MKRYQVQSLGDVIRQAISDADMDDRLREVRAASLWVPTVGEHIASQCGKPWVSRGVLNVSVRNASLRQELNMGRGKLIDSINKQFDGPPPISEIRFIG